MQQERSTWAVGLKKSREMHRLLQPCCAYCILPSAARDTPVSTWSTGPGVRINSSPPSSGLPLSILAHFLSPLSCPGPVKKQIPPTACLIKEVPGQCRLPVWGIPRIPTFVDLPQKALLVPSGLAGAGLSLADTSLIDAWTFVASESCKVRATRSTLRVRLWAGCWSWGAWPPAPLCPRRRSRKQVAPA